MMACTILSQESMVARLCVDSVLTTAVPVIVKPQKVPKNIINLLRNVQKSQN
jgi:hypothetical protein